MKVIYLHQYFNTPEMSGSTRSFEAAKRLVKWGHEVTMITSWRERDSKSDWFVTSEEGIEVHWVPVEYSNSMGFYQRISKFFGFAAKAARRMSTMDADIVLASSTPLTITIPALYFLFRKRTPYVLEVRDLWPDVPIAMGVLRSPVARWAARALERVSYRFASHVVALSPGMAQGVASAGYPESKISVIPNACDLSLFGAADDRSNIMRSICPPLLGRRFLLYPGTIGQVNGVAYLAEVAKHLSDLGAGVAILVVGEGKERQHVLEVAERLGVLERNFFVVSPVAKNKLAEIMALSTAVVSVCIDIPALEANSANKFFDALAAGKPILVNYGGWQKEMIEEHGVGLAVGQDPERAAGLLADWLSRDDVRVAAGASARLLAESEFNRDDLIRKLDGVLRSAGGV